ncbi:hypothetical protein [Pedobacter hartonius]|uniref:Uncharacterized protein n=1 Tax=Pedobacter hartonius TaxID=425514 RepID=A0A1H3ZIG7_9SPHI|nr:hypothetical protein [Pedobacter hartonius]SEA23467.1 hypothetical protein SAMN05443550_102373 [Pedobacter hartonius]
MMINKEQLKELDIQLILEVESELQRAKERFPEKLNSLHEGYAIISEEFDEFWDEIKKKEKDRDFFKLKTEGIHVIAMMIRTLQDLVI